MATINIGSLTFTHKGDYASGTAYVKNDVVYYSTNGNAYVAKTSTTGNAPTSTAHWDIFAAGSGGIWNAGLSLGSAGQSVKVNSAGNALEFGTITTKVIGATRLYNSTRTPIPSQANHVWWSVSHTKTSSTSFLFVQGLAPGQGSMSDQIGEYVEYNSVKNHYGIRHMLYGDGVNTTWMNYHANNLAAGTYDLKLGWTAQNGTAQRWGAVWNPNSSDDGRDHQTGTEMIVWEIEN